ncbi:uncharacterized protein L203_100458 [Cryptococcus depauperatus CBS 7841]|uniref:Uncharacterized protein n=1 Tax=Cryptococcus depauperatus CBS 7841 TaxID=1295531 RepID=A0AAJ8JN31_9TREE
MEGNVLSRLFGPSSHFAVPLQALKRAAPILFRTQYWEIHKHKATSISLLSWLTFLGAPIPFPACFSDNTWTLLPLCHTPLSLSLTVS